MKKIIETSQAPAAVGPYAQAIKAGELVFTSGQIPLTPAGELVEGGLENQAKQALDNLAAVLSEAGSSLSQVVKTTCFLQNMEDFASFNRIYAQYFPAQPPARSCVEVARLPKDVLVEVEAVALV